MQFRGRIQIASVRHAIGHQRACEAFKPPGEQVEIMSKEWRFILLTFLLIALLAGGTFLLFYLGNFAG